MCTTTSEKDFQEQIPEEEINFELLFQTKKGFITNLFQLAPNLINTETKEKGYIPLNSNAMSPICNYMFTEYTILISDLMKLQHGCKYEQHITSLNLNAHALFENSKNINSIKFYNKHNQHTNHLDIDFVFMDAKGKHYQLHDIGQQHPTHSLIYNIIKRNTFHFLIAQIITCLFIRFITRLVN